jgi:hypothetical protein
LFSPASGDHFYTVSAAERDGAIANAGYTDEGVACHVFLSAQAGTAPLLRLFGGMSGDHFYTTSAAERDAAIINLGPTVPVSTALAAMQQVYDTGRNQSGTRLNSAHASTRFGRSRHRQLRAGLSDR